MRPTQWRGKPIDQDELDQWRELAGCVIKREHPILPKPEWKQDVAMVAFVLDNLVRGEKTLHSLSKIAVTPSEPGAPISETQQAYAAGYNQALDCARGVCDHDTNDG